MSFLLLTSTVRGGEKPNVILMMADDVSWECFGCYGAEDYKTPNIDRLAAEGVRFEHCYSTPICTPSRVKIMTGKYGFRNYTHFGYLNPAERTFGHMMQDAGYKTAIAGKWQLNGLYSNNEGCKNPLRPLEAGFNESLLWQVTKTKQEGGERFWSPGLEHSGKTITPEENAGKYGPDLFSNFVCDFIERNKEESFFVYYPMVLVHDPFVPTPDTIGDLPMKGANKEPKNAKEKKANFVAMVEYMDKLVGKITDKVDGLGLGEDTIIMFTGDNGTHPKIRSNWDGRAIQGGKGGMKDNGTHVPFVARWKGHAPEGKVLPDLIDFTDFYTTLAEAAGNTRNADDPIDGRSFLPQLQGESGNPREWVLCNYQPYWNKEPGQFARTANYKLYRDGRYYEVPADLDEANDLASSVDGDAARIRDELHMLLERCPEVRRGKLGKEEASRPTHPDVSNLLE
ncbi:sulfatase-like hydrolase/transferase [Verrucomicrobiales bacterium]|nr:sulfatase-like hydrolase/transferase [Verrucomicrobiales bacterium]